MGLTMYVLHVTKPGAKVRIRKGRFLVEKDGEVLATAPKNHVERIVLHGNVSVTTPALVFCLRRGVPVYFVSGRGNLYGKAAGADYPAVAKLQAQLHIDGASRVGLARSILHGKISSQRAYAWLRQNKASCQSNEPLEILQDVLRRLDRAQSLNELRGLEGTAAAAYFEALSCGWEKYGFHLRNRRPPRDPINAALSYGYAVLQGVVEAAVISAGLHPEIGVLHSTTRRNPALVLDLMEEFRVPVVDRAVGKLFGRGQLKPDVHFGGGNYRTLLNGAGKTILLEGLEVQLQSERKHPADGHTAPLLQQIFRQASKLEAAIVRGKPYAPFWLDNR